MAPRLPRPSLTRTRQLVRESLARGYFQEGPSVRTYFCPLDVEWRTRGIGGPAHMVTVTYWVVQPPTREQIIDAFTRHYAHECVHTAEID